MTAREELFDMARSVIDGELGIMVNGSDIDNTADSLSYAILAAGYRKPRTITTAEELDALPAGTVIRDGDPLTCTKWASGQWGTFSGDSVGSHRITLPATVLYEGAQS